MRKITAALIIVLFTALACTQSPPAQPAEQAPSEPAAPAPQAQPVAQPAPILERTYDPAVAKLFERTDQVKSHSFTVKRLSDLTILGTYFVKGDKVKILPTLKDFSTTRIDVIYLDMTERTAAGYCNKGGSCKDPTFPVPVNYDDWAIVFPSQWIDQARYGAIAGTLTFNNRPVTRIRYDIANDHYDAYIDNFYGYPQRMSITTDSVEGTDGYEYNAMAFNNLKDTDVIRSEVT